MKGFIRVHAILFLLFMLSSGVQAQEFTRRVIDRMQCELNEMTSVMKLSPEQKVKIFELKKEYHVCKVKIIEDFKDKPEANSVALKALNKKHNARLAEICTNDQIIYWNEYLRLTKYK